MYKHLLFYVLLFVIVCSLNVLAGEASSVLPHNMSLPVLNGNFINFNSLNSGFTVLTFFMPNSDACLDVLKWTSELSNIFKNMKFYSITNENNKKLHSFVKKIKGIPPVLIDETNKLGTLFEELKKYFLEYNQLISKSPAITNGRAFDVERLFLARTSYFLRL